MTLVYPELTEGNESSHPLLMLFWSKANSLILVTLSNIG